jgi:hypothetical protein
MNSKKHPTKKTCRKQTKFADGNVNGIKQVKSLEDIMDQIRASENQSKMSEPLRVQAGSDTSDNREVQTFTIKPNAERDRQFMEMFKDLPTLSTKNSLWRSCLAT